ncbi:MAG: hypothetical protein ACNA7M_00710 [Roseovarius sp.]
MYMRATFLISLLMALGLTGPLLAAELVMVERHGCHWCERWNADIAPAYPKTAEGARAPLRRVQIHELPEDIAFRNRPIFTPTFVLVEDGQELGRIEGYGGDEFFWFLLSRLLDAHPDATQAP